MPMHLAGFSESLDPAAAFVRVAALADQRLFISGDDLRVPSLNRVIWLAGGAESTVAPRIRLTSPTLIARGRPEISPLNLGSAAAIEPGSPQAVMDIRENPFTLAVDEILNCDLSSNPAAAQIQWALMCFADSVPTPLAGAEVYSSRWTSGTTVTANAWTPCTMAPDDSLQPGQYAVVGLRPMGATCVAARFIFREQADWRPGALGVDLIGDIQHDMFRAGGLGVWGEFPFTQIPQLEFLCTAADTAQEAEVDLIRIG